MTAGATNASEPLALDEAHARAFLEMLFAKVPGFIEVRTILEGTGTEQTFAATIDKALDAVAGAAKRRRNVYVAIATRLKAGDGSKANLCAARAVWIDRDFTDEGDREAHEVALEGFPLPPSLRVWSGNGEHDYWLLDEPFALDNMMNVVRFEHVLKGLADVLHGDRAATDASRILRVPGTRNYPDAKKRAKGRGIGRVEILR